MDKLEAFRAIVEAHTKARFLAEYPEHTLTVHANSWPCKVKMGRKYANVDVGQSGKYMVVLDTGEIFGIKAYGVIHRGHYYGTLDTINEWDWSGYTGRKLSKQVA